MEYELQVSKEMIQPLYVEIGYMNPDRMAHIMQQLVEIGLVSKPVSLHEFLYQAPSEQWIFWRPWFLLSLAASVLILLLALYLLLCNQRLNREIALRRQREEEIWQLARRDPLTGLPNRLSLMERLDAQIKGAAPGCLLFCDLDDFKQVNDNFGHSHGDALLCQLAERISRSLGPQHFFARLAGDEFVLLLPAMIRRRPTSSPSRSGPPCSRRSRWKGYRWRSASASASASTSLAGARAVADPGRPRHVPRQGAPLAESPG